MKNRRGTVDGGSMNGEAGRVGRASPIAVGA